MKIFRAAAGSLAFWGCLALAQASFTPPTVTAVTDAYRQYQILRDGFVVLDVSIDADGAVSDVKPLRDPGALVPVATSSVREWKFRPAAGESGAIPSDMTVVFVYRPRNYASLQPAPPKDFKPVLPEPRADSADPDYAPPGILAVTYPRYAAMSVSSGSVIIQATISPNGNVAATEVLRPMGPFTRFAIDALAKWQFQPATLRGKPVESKLAIAFMFEPPVAHSN